MNKWEKRDWKKVAQVLEKRYPSVSSDCHSTRGAVRRRIRKIQRNEEIQEERSFRLMRKHQTATLKPVRGGTLKPGTVITFNQAKYVHHELDSQGEVRKVNDKGRTRNKSGLEAGVKGQISGIIEKKLGEGIFRIKIVHTEVLTSRLDPDNLLIPAEYLSPIKLELQKRPQDRDAEEKKIPRILNTSCPFDNKDAIESTDSATKNEKNKSSLIQQLLDDFKKSPSKPINSFIPFFSHLRCKFEFTNIQAAAIPEMLLAKNILAIAPTGSGKTLAYIIPVVAHCNKRGTLMGPVVKGQVRLSAPQAVVVLPTRELVMQVESVCEKIQTRYTFGVRAISLYGGVGKEAQVDSLLQWGSDEVPCFILSTPGRLLDLLTFGALVLSSVSLLVLDEADRMLNLGFATQMSAICSKIPPSAQLAVFSATFIKRIAPRLKELCEGRDVKVVSCNAIDIKNSDAIVEWLLEGNSISEGQTVLLKTEQDSTISENEKKSDIENEVKNDDISTDKLVVSEDNQSNIVKSPELKSFASAFDLQEEYVPVAGKDFLEEVPFQSDDETVEDIKPIKKSQSIYTLNSAISHVVSVTAEHRKQAKLCRTLDALPAKAKVLIFCKTIKRVNQVAAFLDKRHRVSKLHSELAQKERTSSLQQFTRGATRILVATDLVSRGIDIQDISVVINFDFPSNLEIYCHRSGRAGRNIVKQNYVDSNEIIQKQDTTVIAKLIPVVVSFFTREMAVMAQSLVQLLRHVGTTNIDVELLRLAGETIESKAKKNAIVLAPDTIDPMDN